MASTVVNVKYVNPAQPGKKNATIKTDDDQLYLVPPEMIDQFSAGAAYKIDYRTSTFRGVTYKYVEKIEKAVSSPSGVARHQAGKYGTVDMETAERIFVCGAMNALVGNQNLDPRGLTADDLVAEVKKLRAVWGATFGNPQKDEEMGDEIPF